MVEELAVRSEKSSLESLSQTLNAINGTKDTDELAYMLLMVTEFYGDAGCRCEELGAAYGENSEEALICNRGVAKGREEILETYKRIIDKLRGGG